MSPLPPCTAEGYLPPGVHSGTLAEIEDRFASTERRRALMLSLRQAVDQLARIPFVKRIIIDGCFIGPREDSHDVDILVAVEKVTRASANAAIDRGRAMSALRKAVRPDIDLLPVPDESPVFRTMLDYFSEDKPEHGGLKKGVVEVPLR